jgi:hypothetical protein
MSPKINYFFSPLKTEAADLIFNYKKNFPFIYYTVQILKIVFLGLILYLMFYMKLGVIELYQMFYLNIIYQGNLTQSLLIAKIFSILMPFFLVVIVVDVGLRLYLIFFL